MSNTACMVDKKKYTTLVETPYEKRLFDRDVDGKITLKWILEKLVV